MQSSCTRALELAEAAYGADADHIARFILAGLLLRDDATLAEVHRAIDRGLARFADRRRRLRRGLPSGEDSGRSALAS
jgi:hypothetical protein